MVCAMVIALADLFYPTIARNIINVYVPNKMWNMFLLWSAVLLVIYLIKMGMNYFVQYYGHVMGNRLQGDMRQCSTNCRSCRFRILTKTNRARSCPASSTT